MKKLSKISLHNLSQAELAKKGQSLLKGGIDLPTVCIVACGCKYAGEKKTLMTLSMEGRVRLLAVTLMDLFIKTNELGEI